MYIQLNNQNEIIGYADILLDTRGWLEVSEPMNPDDFRINYNSYDLDENNKLIYNPERHILLKKLKEDSLLKTRREQECFPVINRGREWYDKLTEQQTIELSQWYKAWLDAPQTGIAPDKPLWI